MAFLSFIFYAILVVWLISLLGRLFLNWWLSRKMRKFGADGTDRRWRGASSRRDANREEGDVSVQQTARTEKKVNRNVGEYVEFEEIEVTEETNCGE